ncbi:MAG: hypothetical protein WC501_02000 [Candidatus Micrarchaeia archaeon]
MGKKPPTYKLEERLKAKEIKPPLEEERHGIKQIEITIARGNKKYKFLIKGKDISEEEIIDALKSEGSLFDVGQKLIDSEVLIKDGAKWREFGFLSLNAFYKRALEQDAKKKNQIENIICIEETSIGPGPETIIRQKKVRSTDGAELGIIAGHRKIKSIEGSEAGTILGHGKIKTIEGSNSGEIIGHAKVKTVEGMTGVATDQQRIENIANLQPGQKDGELISKVIEEEIEKQKKRIKKEPWE